MIVDALVPVKGAGAGKERLAGALSPEARAALVRGMLTDIVAALRTAPGLRSVAVTSADPELLALAERLGAVPLPEPAGTRGLNAALAAGIAALAARGAEAVLIVQGDVPEITAADVAAVLQTAPDGPCVRIVPSADGGTSALLLAPLTVIAPAFGRESGARHRQAAGAAGVSLTVIERPGLARDVDRPDDLAALRRSASAQATRAVLEQIARADADTNAV